MPTGRPGLQPEDIATCLGVRRGNRGSATARPTARIGRLHGLARWTIAYNEGTYALSFHGKAAIGVAYNYGTVHGSTSSTGTYNVRQQARRTAALVSHRHERGRLLGDLHELSTYRRQRDEHEDDQNLCISTGPSPNGASTSYEPRDRLITKAGARQDFAKWSVIRFQATSCSSNHSTPTNCVGPRRCHEK